jgi:hypothetical protein
MASIRISRGGWQIGFGALEVAECHLLLALAERDRWKPKFASVNKALTRFSSHSLFQRKCLLLNGPVDLAQLNVHQVDL